MIEITAEIRALIDKAAAGVELAEDECIDLSDGLIHCKKCGGQRQTVVPCFGKSGYFMPRCICQCQQEAEEQRKAAEERQRRMERMNALTKIKQDTFLSKFILISNPYRKWSRSQADRSPLRGGSLKTPYIFLDVPPPARKLYCSY